VESQKNHQMSVGVMVHDGANETLDCAAQVQGKWNAAAWALWPAPSTPGECARTPTSVHF